MPAIAVLLNEASTDFRHEGIGFVAMADDERISCFISEKALRDHFGGSGIGDGDLMDLFRAKQGRIQSTVRGKITDGAREADGSILLQSDDFWI